MQSKVNTVEEYLKEIPEERQESFSRLRATILENLPSGFQEKMSYGMIGYIIPHEIYPAGYHCNPKLPLPFAGLASQKNFIAFYHMGIYENKELYDWFVTEYPSYSKRKLDIGKSCIRFKKEEDIPYELIGELISKISVETWISRYEKAYKKQ